MPGWYKSERNGGALALTRALLLATTALAVSACSETMPNLDLGLGASAENDAHLSDLERAQKQYAKAPHEPAKALTYANILKQNGRKTDAFAILERAHQANKSDRAIMSAYGRLALELGKLSLAKALLERADDPSNPDWRVLSARGAVLAKQGDHKASIPFFERARLLSNDHPSAVNNLALAYMMSGEAQRAEPLLRQASMADPTNVKVRQNLALVLSLQGRYSEAKAIASRDLSPEAAEQNAELMRKIVRIEQKPQSAMESVVASSGWETTADDKPPKPARRTAARKPKPKAPAPVTAKASAQPALRGSAVETSSTN